MSFKISMRLSINPTSVISEIYTLPGIVSVNMSEKEFIKNEE
jgi:hypothetical protein